MRVLLVEDSADDAAAIQRLAAGAQPAITLSVACDAEEASAYLSRREPDAGCEAPLDLVLLDMQLPGTPGVEVLQRIKADPSLRDIPVVVLSGSDRDEDVRKAQELGAHSYVIKPMTARHFAWIARSVDSYRAWLARNGGRSP
jgi:two-component system response regulator